MIFPIVEMSGFKNKYIPEICYIYLERHSGSVDQTIGSIQADSGIYLRSKEPYPTLECLYTD